MPQSFIQQFLEQITHHAGWIIQFPDLLESKFFQFSVPMFGHYVAIITTIHLHHSFMRNDTLNGMQGL